MQPAEEQLPPEIADALQAARVHRAVNGARLLIHDADRTLIEVEFDAELPSRFRGAGQSPTGVRPAEVVAIEFDRRFPRTAPRVTLRKGFNNSLPHINPHRPGEPVPPCIVFGSLSEVFHRAGFPTVLDQIADWLRKAARNELIDAAQGWEPMRRDSIMDILVFEQSCTQGLFSKKEEAKTFATTFVQVHGRQDHGLKAVYGYLLLSHPVPVNSKTLNRIASQSDPQSGETISIICWPGKTPAGDPVVCGEYIPETVTNIGDLLERADAYGCGRALRDKLCWLRKCAKDLKSTLTYPMFIILSARRPMPLIGSTSPIEIIVYRVDVGFPTLLSDDNVTIVHPVAHRHPIRDDLLRRMSGIDLALQKPKISLIGCGSLGSKLAVHLGRAAFTPSAVADWQPLDPHHMARHALLPKGNLGEFLFVPSKSKALAEALTPFGSCPTEVTANVALLEPGLQEFEILFPDDTSLVVNTTASHLVRDFLATTPGITARVADAALFNGGRVGLFTLEGPSRNPDTLDLAALAYEEMRTGGMLGDAFSVSATSGDSVAIGQGCSSITMVMTDARLSMHAAPMAEKLLGLMTNGKPEHGELLIGQIDGDGMSLTWRCTAVGPTQVLAAENDATWTIRVLDRAHRKILDETARHPHAETGGIVVGRVSPVRRLIHITDVLEAPQDSQRSAEMFVLGVDGVEALVTSYTRSAAEVLWCLGTWHSHLAEQGASQRDYETAHSLIKRGCRAAVLLIRRPSGYSAIVVPGG